jgi:hypothetical protein
MPNPRIVGRDRNDMPLDEAVGYATHVVIRCCPPSCDARPCGRWVTWRTEDLYQLLPNCRTFGEFKEKLYCRQCQRRGWLTIEAAPR